MPWWNQRLQMGWAALVMGLSVLLSRFMGLIRDKTIAYLFGATQESDIYFAAFVIPDFINYLLAGAYFSITLIPLLSETFARDHEDGWRLFSAVLVWVATGIIVFTGIAMILAPQLAVVAAPGLDPPAWARLTTFLRIILPAQAAFLPGACLLALLYLRKQFHVPALVPIIYNGSIILVGVLLRGNGMEGFCWGVLVGAFAGNLLLPWLVLRRSRDWRPCWTWWHPGIKRFLWLAVPLMVGQSVVVLDEQMVRIFGSLAGTGAISWLNYARRIMLVPVGIVAQAAGVASYPFLADLAARKDFHGFHRTINETLRNTLTMLIPLSLWMMVVAYPTIVLIFQQGHFGSDDTQHTMRLLIILLAVVSCWGWQQIVGRAFYARQDTITPAVLGTLATLAALPLYYFASRWWGASGVALASALSIGIYTLALSWRWRQRFGADAFAGLAKGAVQVLIVALTAGLPAMSVTMACLQRWPHHPYGASVTAIAASGVVFALGFVLLANWWMPQLIRPFLEKAGPLGRRMMRD
ncbi:MAG TPA: murein biosynthesis integral membrane protein MurJ [Syntrophobacteraceae bacterium]|nr:murein biosynthesis integral membrane protein MurJ [Syntrophobacteraceae bacterium]